jgi:hypothetical protein
MASNDDAKKYPCPFRECKASYSNVKGLKIHLRTTRGAGYDPLHPHDDPEWRKLDDEGFLKVSFAMIVLLTAY